MNPSDFTTDTGTTVTLTERDGETLVMLGNAATGQPNVEAGRIIHGSFQPVPFAAWGITPPALRAIADLIDGPEASYIAFIEHNDNEGETWTHWIPLPGNADEIDRLRTFLDARGIEGFTVGAVPVTESEVDILVKVPGNTDYMAEHTKLIGVLNLPEELEFRDLYKGGISGLMDVSEEAGRV